MAADSDDQATACARAQEEVTRIYNLAQKLSTPTAAALVGGGAVAVTGAVTLDPPVAIGGGLLFDAGLVGLSKITDLAMKQGPAAIDEAVKVCSGLSPTKGNGQQR